VLRPGIAFAELVQAMEAPLREAGCWAKTPLCRTIGWAATGHTRVNLEDLAGTEEGALEGAADRGVVGGDLVLRPGMTLALSPNACSGPHRVTLGGSVLVTEASREELNALPTRVMHVA